MADGEGDGDGAGVVAAAPGRAAGGGVAESVGVSGWLLTGAVWRALCAGALKQVCRGSVRQ